MRCLSIVAGIFCAAFSLQSLAQNSSTQVSFVIPKSATVNFSDISVDWNPILQNVEAPKPDGSNKSQLQKIKDSLSKVYPKKSQIKVSESPSEGAIKKGGAGKKNSSSQRTILRKKFSRKYIQQKHTKR